MRIIGGSLKGHRFTVPSNIKARPTTDFARESLFNILTNMVEFDGKYALDLFSGTGSISFEFVSRGCKAVDLMEINNQNFRHIKKNIEHLRIKNINPFRYDVFKFLQKTANRYDLIFADPPYELDKIDTIPDIIVEKKLLNDNGIFVLEHSKNHDFKQHRNFMELRKYGSVHFSFFA